ncbi:hypothetical protein RHGRI_034658 [Rhododendron griersonianum]|uniref:RING-type E3 ubiquitin transferase n=1 Tax=Rhododendron griersonianum TaxID=479676 RepID=A0AAV6I203_9ERIC|nr:hypothetical protein RHGRI_034658 [Rhododendron griersonianum]
MPIPVSSQSSTIAEHLGYRRPTRNHPIPDPDPDPQQMPSLVQSTRCKSTISSLLLSTFTPTNTTTTTKNKATPSGSSFMGLGCAAASAQVSVPSVIRSSANWEDNQVRRKKKKQKRKKTRNQDVAMGSSSNNNASSSIAVVVPDVWCGPGIGLTADAAAASVDCVVSRTRMPVSGRTKVDAENKGNQRERSSCPARRMVRPEPMPSLDSEYAFGMRHSGLDVFGARNPYHHHVRHRSPDNLEEILMLQNSMMFGGRSDGFDRFRDWRIDVDSMSYEELLELSERIGNVNTGLKEDEIVHCLRKAKHMDNLFSPLPKEMEQKCSICQEDYQANEETGKLECGHFYHIQCIKQWLVRKNMCPICKTVVATNQ